MSTVSTDLDALHGLNHDYITSVQKGDVRRFDEILAAEFHCSNPDGSLINREGFLAQTARPVTISNLQAPSFTPAPLIRCKMVAMAPAATLTSGRGKTIPGAVCQHTLRACNSPRFLIFPLGLATRSGI
jgi:hypothetical protein